MLHPSGHNCRSELLAQQRDQVRDETDRKRYEKSKGEDNSNDAPPPSDPVRAAGERAEPLDLALEGPLVVLERGEADTTRDVGSAAPAIRTGASPSSVTR